MKAKNRDEMLYRVLRAMRRLESDSKRYKLQQIGESLIGEYLDLKQEDVEKLISNIESN